MHRKSVDRNSGCLAASIACTSFAWGDYFKGLVKINESKDCIFEHSSSIAARVFEQHDSVRAQKESKSMRERAVQELLGKLLWRKPITAFKRQNEKYPGVCSRCSTKFKDIALCKGSWWTAKDQLKFHQKRDYAIFEFDCINYAFFKPTSDPHICRPIDGLPPEMKNLTNAQVGNVEEHRQSDEYASQYDSQGDWVIGRQAAVQGRSIRQTWG